MKTKVLIELEIESQENCDLAVEAHAIANDVLDAGVLQDAIVDMAALRVRVKSALVVRGRP